MKTREQSTPKDSIWGAIQTTKKIAEGVFVVGTNSHGGIMVDINHLVSYCTPAQVCHGGEVDESQNWVCFEEDLCASVFIDTNRRLFDGLDEAALDRDLQKYFPAYLEDRIGSSWDSLMDN